MTKTLPGNDHYHAMDKVDLKDFFKNIREIFNVLGNFEVQSLDVESLSVKKCKEKFSYIKVY